MTHSASIDPDWAAKLVASLPPLATVAEVTAVLRCSRRTVHRLAAAGRLRNLRHNGTGSSRLLFPRDDVADYLRSLDLAA